MPVTYPVKISIWAAAGGRCCKCKIYLVKDLKNGLNKSNQGEVAHIEGENDGAKRYNKYQSDEERNSFPNLMLMCPNDHTEIDNDEIKYTVEVLKEIKSNHENWVKNQLASAATNISFVELAIVLKYLTSNTENFNTVDLKVIPPGEKISKNNLSPTVANYITMGMLRSELVKDYLNRNPDVNFANNLRKGFVEKYDTLRGTMSGDELFYSLLDFASSSSNEFSILAAALTVVVYFFQICDIFES